MPALLVCNSLVLRIQGDLTLLVPGSRVGLVELYRVFEVADLDYLGGG